MLLNQPDVDELSVKISIAIAEHYQGHVSIYETLCALSKNAAYFIRKAPPEATYELLDAWDSSPAWVRSTLVQKQ